MSSFRNWLDRISSYDIDVKLTKILSDEEELSNEERFIKDVKDHLSTCINRNYFTINNEFFIDPYKFEITSPCECKVHIETKNDFVKFLIITLSMYKGYDDFDASYLINSYLLDKITRGELIEYCDSCGKENSDCSCKEYWKDKKNI